MTWILETRNLPFLHILPSLLPGLEGVAKNFPQGGFWALNGYLPR